MNDPNWAGPDGFRWAEYAEGDPTWCAFGCGGEGGKAAYVREDDLGCCLRCYEGMGGRVAPPAK